MAGASMKDIKLRIKSVESTMQITKAMQLVATSKLRRAKERMENSKPFTTIAQEAISAAAAKCDDATSPSLIPAPSSAAATSSSQATAVWRAAITPTCSRQFPLMRKAWITACCPLAARLWSASTVTALNR